MTQQTWEDLWWYREKLRSYSTQELEDIYFHIHILQHPLRYRMLIRELEVRGLRSCPPPPAPRCFDLPQWLEAHSFLRSHPSLRAVTRSLLVFVLTTLITFSLFLPIWVFSIPLHFIGPQAALVYFACAPIPPILGAGIGGKLGGRGLYGIWVLLGVLVAMGLFHETGAPAVIVRAVLEPQGSSGSSFTGFCF